MSIFDEILGKTELKEKINELEEEIESLEKQLEAENERRAKAVTEKQEAEREINRLEDKIQELEDRVEKAEVKERKPSFRTVQELTPKKTENVLNLLESVQGTTEELTTAKIAPDDDTPEVVSGESIELLRKIDSETGRIVFTDDNDIVSGCFVPPLPISETQIINSDRFLIDSSLFKPRENYCLAVLRSDAFGAGIYEPDKENSKDSVFVTSSVKSSHSKGGWSQKRFERIRDEQIQNHLNESAEKIEDLLEGHDVGFVAVAGEKGYLKDFASEIEYEGETITKNIDTHGQKEGMLQTGYRNFWRSRLYVF